MGHFTKLEDMTVEELRKSMRNMADRISDLEEQNKNLEQQVENLEEENETQESTIDDMKSAFTTIREAAEEHE